MTTPASPETAHPRVPYRWMVASISSAVLLLLGGFLVLALAGGRWPDELWVCPSVPETPPADGSSLSLGTDQSGGEQDRVKEFRLAPDGDVVAFQWHDSSSSFTWRDRDFESFALRVDLERPQPPGPAGTVRRLLRRGLRTYTTDGRTVTKDGKTWYRLVPLP